MDKILVDVDKVIFEYNTPVCKTRIMRSVHGYYYIEMGNESGFKLDSMPPQMLKCLTKALIEEIAESEESL